MDYPTEEVLTRICDVHWNHSRDGDADGVHFSDIHMHDAINHTLSGSVEVDGKVYGFVIDNGNWNGTVVREWGDPEDIGLYEPPEPDPRTFVPKNRDLRVEKPHMFNVYLMWREADWFKEMERKMNYDLHFSPTEKIYEHYKQWANRKGMTIGRMSELKHYGIGGKP